MRSRTIRTSWHSSLGLTANWHPPTFRELFEQYISTATSAELRQLQDIFSEAKRNAFWVVEIDAQIVGMFGIESRSDEATELRRMHLTDPIAGAALRSACCNVPKRERGSSFSQS